MALDLSIIASAERLQAQRDQRVEAARARQREEAVQRAREAEREAQERRLAERTADSIDAARVQREYVRGVADDNLVEDALVRDVYDRRTDVRAAQEQQDLQRVLSDEQRRTADRDAAINALAPLTPTAPPAPAPEASDVAASPGAGPQTFEQLLSERNVRLTERAAQEQQFAAARDRDFARSVNSVNELQSDPNAFPAEPVRGAVVDFSA